MEPVSHFEKPLTWTRAWLNSFKHATSSLGDDFELIDDTDATSSEFGVASRKDAAVDDDQSFVLVENPDPDAANPQEHLLDNDEKSRTSHPNPDRRPGIGYKPYYLSSIPGGCHRSSVLSYDDRPGSLTSEEWTRFDIDNLYEEQREILFGKGEKSDAVNYEIAGRVVENDFCDLRSAAKARRKCRSDAIKYYGYRYVNRGQLGEQHYDLRKREYYFQWSDVEIIRMDKKTMYEEAQRWPRPPKYHRSHRWDKCDYLRGKQRKHRIQRLNYDLSEAL